MPNHKATAKRLKTDKMRRTRNRATKSRIHTLSKNLRTLVDEGNGDAAREQLRTVSSAIDKAAKNHRLHRNTAARRKARLAKLVARLPQATS